MADVSKEEALKRLAGGGKRKKGGATTRAAPTGPLMLEHLRFFIPGMLTQSLNTGIRQHKGEKHQAKKRWYDTLLPAFSHLLSEECKKYRWRVAIERRSTKLLDYTNLAGSMKPLEDVLRDLGCFRDDSPEHIDIEPTQQVVSRDEVGMLITLERLGRLENGHAEEVGG